MHCDRYVLIDTGGAPRAKEFDRERVDVSVGVLAHKPMLSQDDLQRRPQLDRIFSRCLASDIRLRPYAVM